MARQATLPLPVDVLEAPLPGGPIADDGVRAWIHEVPAHEVAAPGRVLSLETPACIFTGALEDAARSGKNVDLERALRAADQAEDAGVGVDDLLRLAGDVAQVMLDVGSCSPSAAMELLRRVTEGLVAGRVGDRHSKPNQAVISESLFAAVADGRRLDSEQEAQLSGYGLPPSCTLIFPVGILLTSATAATHAAVASDLRRRDVLAIAEGERVLALLASPPGPALLPPGATSVACPPAIRSDLRLAVERLGRALDLARTLGLQGRVAFDELLVDLLLAESPTLAAELAARLGCLAGDGEDRLLTTVRTFLDCRGQRGAAARALHVHPNTLDLRLRRVRQLTGLDVRVPKDLVRLVLGLRAVEGCPSAECSPALAPRPM